MHTRTEKERESFSHVSLVNDLGNASGRWVPVNNPVYLKQGENELAIVSQTMGLQVSFAFPSCSFPFKADIRSIRHAMNKYIIH